jgi:signal transduction histidine kinase
MESAAGKKLVFMREQVHPAGRTQLDRRIFAQGEMADRVRDFDWAGTPVGPLHQWPELLVSTVNTLLGSRQPMLLFWGEELIQIYNDAFAPSLGSDKRLAALGRRGEQFWAEIWHVVGPLLHGVMQSGEPYWSENQLIPMLRDGRMQDVYWTFSYSPVWDSEGRICGILVVCLDTTAIVVAEKAAERERERLLGILQQAPAFFALLQGPDHVFTMVNPLYLQLIHHREVLGKPIREAVLEAVEQGYVEILDRVYRGERYEGFDARYDAYTGDGEAPDERYVDFVYEPLRESDGTISGIIVLGVDVTDRKKSHDALLQTEKLAAVGRLASSIAHEINNPLEAVTNLIYLAKDSAVNEDAIRYLKSAETELRRVSVITNQTLRFHRQTTAPTRCTTEELIASTLAIYQGRLANSAIHIERRSRESPPVLCYDGEIRQVLSNLLGNAIDAMNGAGGRILIRNRPATDWRSGRKGITITFADTGVGMTKQTSGRIFEPFFTTKGVNGTGLGLWVSGDIIRRHQGNISIRSRQEPGPSGTVFALFLPYAPEAPAPEH